MRPGVGPSTLAAAVLFLLPAAGLAQGLGDAAARERQKREQQPRDAQGKDVPKRVFTNDDLPTGGEAASPADAADPKAAAAGRESAADAAKNEGDAAAKAGPDDPIERERKERQRLEADWRVRFANARERLAVAEENSWQEVVRTEFYQGVPVQMKVKEKVETPELVAARQAMADLEEEFRRTGLPPGWARER
jgi:hypothetical protein